MNQATATNFAPAFESDEDTGMTMKSTTETVQSLQTLIDNNSVAQTTEVTLAAPSALVLKPTGAVGLRKPVVDQIIANLKDAMVVEYNTLPQIICNNGAFLSREDKKNLGDSIVFELHSFQESYVVSPNDDKAPMEMVRFSNDGITCTDEELTPCKEHLQFLLDNGYPKASIKERVIVVGELISAAKTADMNGELVQLDLSPKSRVMWNRFLFNVTNKLKTGKLQPDAFKVIKAVCIDAIGADNKSFTQAKFDLVEQTA